MHVRVAILTHVYNSVYDSNDLLCHDQAWVVHNEYLQPHGEIRGSCYWYNQSFNANNPDHIEVDDDHIDQDFYVYVTIKRIKQYTLTYSKLEWIQRANTSAMHGLPAIIPYIFVFHLHLCMRILLIFISQVCLQ